MIITKTPFRISFFGGGTDHPSWFKENGGKVIASTFDKYCYISTRLLPPFFDHKFRLVYSIIENINNINEIQHPSVREVLKYYNSKKGLEIHHDGDLPSKSGLGSSSSFTVGLINAINAMQGVYKSPIELAREAIHIEQDLIKECVGSQDQISAAYGGFNEIEFYKDGTFSVEPLLVNPERKQSLNDHLMLFFTGISRFSSDVAESQVANMSNCLSQLNELHDMTREGSSILTSSVSLDDFGILLDKSWAIKKTLSPIISSSSIDEIYQTAKNSGAIGGKILGAGGGGFILLFVKPQDQNKVKNALKNLTFVPFSFENTGSKVIVYQPSSY